MTEKSLQIYIGKNVYNFLLLFNHCLYFTGILVEKNPIEDAWICFKFIMLLLLLSVQDILLSCYILSKQF